LVERHPERVSHVWVWYLMSRSRGPRTGHRRRREIDTVGDRFLTTFDGPARAVRCAAAVSGAVRWLGVQIRAGLHTGEYEVIGEKRGGIVVHIGARVTAMAAPNEVRWSGSGR